MEKLKGFQRFSLEANIPGTKTSARSALERLRTTPITPASKKTAKFLCPICWKELSNAYKGLVSMEERISAFWEKTEESSYLSSKKRTRSATTPTATPSPRKLKTPKVVTPEKVGLHRTLLLRYHILLNAVSSQTI